MSTGNAQPDECWSVDGQSYEYDSLGDLLDDLDDLEPGCTVYVGEKEHPEVEHLCDADDVIDTIANRAYDIAGEWAEDCASVSPEAKSELNALLVNWMKKHCNLNFYTVENAKPYLLSTDDFPGNLTPVEADALPAKDAA